MKRSTPKPHRTKIVCTLGPSTATLDVVRDLIEAGADVFRINLSHGTREAHAEAIELVRRASRELNHDAALLLDLQGVRMRTTACRSGPFELREGTEVEVSGGEEPSDSKRIHIAPAAALQGLRRDDRILIDDGKVCLRAVQKAGEAWTCLVMAGGLVKDRKGVNLPDTPTRELPALTPKDIADIEWGAKQGADLFALSFVRSAADVVAAKRAIGGLGADTPVIAKLEKPDALQDLDGILEESFGVMVARGDLGVEAPPEKVPVMQKKIIAEARRLMKPVITATQMLESMIERPVPTRAEASDVANAVFDGTDAVMLSGETSVGKHPVETVRMMGRIVAEAEAEMLRTRKPRTLSTRKVTFATAVGAAACVAAESVRARCIIVYTHSGYTATLVSGYRPVAPVYTFGPDEPVLRRLGLVWGIETRRLARPPASVEDLIRAGEAALLAEKAVDPGDAVVLVAGMPFHQTGNTNFLKMHRIEEGS
ncbi:MAG: pyruvate kinase [Planctomycetes bacterium]|nr:pyruvate kinase [Planctomycetota bacterium]